MTEVSGYRASPQQEACWRLQHGASDHPFRARLVLRVDGPLDRAALEQRLGALLATEEIFRTSLHCVAGMTLPLQYIGDMPLVSIAFDGLRGAVGAGCSLSVHAAADDCGGHVLALSAPATHADAASLTIVAGHLICPGTPVERLQYADYAEWKHGLLGAAGSPGAAYWAQHQSNPAPPLALRLASQAAGGGFEPHSMELAGDGAAILRQCEALACAPKAWMLTAWMIFLSRLSAQTVVEVACADNGRGDALDNAIGLYELAIPVRASIDQSNGFRQLVGAVADASAMVLGWRDYHDGLTVPPIGYVFNEAPAWPPLAQGRVTLLDMQCVAQRFELRLRVRADGGQLACAFDYDASCWNADAIAILGEQWQMLLTALSSDAERPVGSIGLVGPLQRAVIAPGRQQPAIEAVSVVELIERQAAAMPEAPAVADISATLSYRAMNDKANLLARRLVRKGVQPGDIVGIALPRCNDMIVAVLAVLKAGAAYLALDPAYPAERLAFMARDSGAIHIIRAMEAEGTIAVDDPDNVGHSGAGNPGIVRDLSLPAYLIYTSGSTGAPKAVEVSHRSLSQSTQVRIGFYANPVRSFLLLSSLSFDSSVAGIFWTLAQGGTLVLPASGDELVLDNLCDAISRHSVSHSLSLPSLYGALLDHAPSAALASIDTWIVAGEACSDQLVEQHHRLLPHARLVNEYGPTEGGVWASAEALQPGRPAGIGHPIPGMELDLINDFGMPAAIGETGEIYLAGTQLASGYRGHTSQTAAAFVTLAHIAGGRRAYRTGDAACRLADGRLMFQGRRDYQVKIRGYRVELAEIERQLLSHGEIGDAVVVAQEHGGGRRLLAYFTARQASVPDAAALRDYLGARLPAYMVPALFIALPALPLTPNGKRDLNALPDPDSARVQYVAPSNDLEKELADICAEVLRLPRIGVTDNFFQTGGDSILSLQLVTRANRAGISLSTAQVFEHQTVQAMAANVQWRRVDRFAADVGWLQSWTDPELLASFGMAESRYRLDAGEVLAAALARALLSGQVSTLRLIRLHDGGNGQYETQHAFEPGASAWDAFAPAAKAALRRESDTASADGAHACLSLRELAASALEARAQASRAPLQLAATLMPHALTLAWTADSRHHNEERLRQLSSAVAQGLIDLASHCASGGAARLQAHDFPAAGLDQDALEELLAELNGGGLAT